MKTAVSYQIAASEQIIPVIEQALDRLQSGRGKILLSQQIRTDLKAAFTEAVTNAIVHARELERGFCVKGRIYSTDKSVCFTVIDHGKGFSMNRVPVPDFNDPQSSGRGIFMMRQLGDEVLYRRGKRSNRLVFKRHLTSSGSMRELDLLYEMSEAVLRQSSLEEVCRIILNRALEIFAVERASILIYDEDIKRLKVVASRGIAEGVRENIRIRPGEGISGYVFQHGKPLLIEDINVNAHGLKRQDHYKSRSFISAPMISSPLRMGGKPWGVINLTERKNGKKFTKKDLMLLSTIANQAMACLYQRRLLEESKMAQTLRDQLETVRLIQNSYLPLKAPQIKGCDIAGACEMAETVGGDYFDYIRKGYWLYVVVADVSGHDLGSTMTMVNFRAQLRALLEFESDPARILTMLNASLHADLQAARQFVSCLLARFDTQIGRLEWANAGHYPPLFFPDPLVLGKSGLVMGVYPDVVYENSRLLLPAGTGALFYTDGVLEAMNGHGEIFGLDRLQDLVGASPHLDSRQLVDTIIRRVMQFRSTSRPMDDLTVVSLRFS